MGTQSSSTRMSRAWASASRRVEGREVAEERVDVAVVGDVVAEVRHRRAVDRRQPERVDAEPLQVVQPRAHALEVADAVARGVGERARIDLVDDGLLPPHAAAKATGRRRRWRLGCRPWQRWNRSESSAPGSWARASRSPRRGPGVPSRSTSPSRRRSSTRAARSRARSRGRSSAASSPTTRARRCSGASTWSTDLDALAEAELVVEAIVEDEAVKAKTFKRLDAAVGARGDPRVEHLVDPDRRPRRRRPAAPTACWGCTSSRRCRS